MAGDTGEQPWLRDEAKARKDWRGEEGEAPKPETSGHSLPASEDRDETMAAGDSGQSKVGPPGTVPPPD
ncbi:MAG: hypothetical protein ACK40O_07960 [Allosphingosinicella sp.]